MALDAASQLGKIIGKLGKEQQVTNENLGPEEIDGQLLIKRRELVELVGTFTVTQRLYPTDSFILDHPVYGELDSAVLQLDGGYDVTPPTFPLTFPISFTASASEIYTTTF